MMFLDPANKRSGGRSRQNANKLHITNPSSPKSSKSAGSGSEKVGRPIPMRDESQEGPLSEPQGFSPWRFTTSFEIRYGKTPETIKNQGVQGFFVD